MWFWIGFGLFYLLFVVVGLGDALFACFSVCWWWFGGFGLMFCCLDRLWFGGCVWIVVLCWWFVVCSSCDIVTFCWLLFDCCVALGCLLVRFLGCVDALYYGLYVLVCRFAVLVFEWCLWMFCVVNCYGCVSCRSVLLICGLVVDLCGGVGVVCSLIN